MTNIIKNYFLYFSGILSPNKSHNGLTSRISDMAINSASLTNLRPFSISDMVFCPMFIPKSTPIAAVNSVCNILFITRAWRILSPHTLPFCTTASVFLNNFWKMKHLKIAGINLPCSRQICINHE